MKQLVVALSLLLTALLARPNREASVTANPPLLAQISRIKAIDNHAHHEVRQRGEKPDD